MNYINRFCAGWRDLMENKSDPRTSEWFLMSSPLPTAAICLAYVVIVKIVGPKLMENRKPYKLKNVLIFYNFLQVIFSTWLFYEASSTGWLTDYSYRCQPVDYTRSENGMRIARGCYWYYISKFTEFLDTFFFVMRKRYDQVSTLHVIHHGIMPFSVWWGVKFTPGGHSSFFGFINTFVHIVMYFYYMLAAMGPQMQKYLWWKKYLTLLQMVQFIMVMVHAFQLLLYNPCNYPIAFVWWIGAHAVMFYFLFSNFYKQAYKKKRIAAEKKKDREHKYINNNDSTKDYHYGTTQLYYSPTDKMEESYSTTRQRVFIGSKN
ncbi:unnamed protein product [Chironomus riparius]|uniref:Elongation of very long chain fatty acids protein n=1 Tax=Chironomus riparius TaxID=315576 RepID=A0A9N9S058_9DIPT|nr:unnamed protein product [Chironomus riparius]